MTLERRLEHSDRHLWCDGWQSVSVVCNAQQRWQWLACPLLDVVLPCLWRSSPAKTNFLCSVQFRHFDSVSCRQTWPGHGKVRRLMVDKTSPDVRQGHSSVAKRSHLFHLFCVGCMMSQASFCSTCFWSSLLQISSQCSALTSKEQFWHSIPSAVCVESNYLSWFTSTSTSTCSTNLYVGRWPRRCCWRGFSFCLSWFPFRILHLYSPVFRWLLCRVLVRCLAVPTPKHWLTSVSGLRNNKTVPTSTATIRVLASANWIRYVVDLAAFTYRIL